MAASRSAEVSDEERCEMKINAVLKSTQNATKYGVKHFNGKPAFCFELNYFNLKVSLNQQKYRFNTEQPRKYSSSNLFQTEWFAQQKEFKTEFESMEVEEMNNCPSKFYLSARRKDGSYYKKIIRTSLSYRNTCCSWLLLSRRVKSSSKKCSCICSQNVIQCRHFLLAPPTLSSKQPTP